MREGWLDVFLFWLQYTNFVSLSNEESVIPSPIIPVYTLRKNREIKKNVSPQKTPLLIDSLTQPELAKRLR